MRKYMIICAAAVFAVALGCVIRTEHKIDAHITLDIRHIADQAESVLDFVEGKSDTLPGMEDTPAPESRLRRVLNALNPVQAAYAESLAVTTSPLVKEIATSMRDRNPQIDALKQQGCLGENNRGYVDLRECDAIKDAEQRNDAQKLVADENKDRKALYAEIARLNRETPGVNVGKVETIYAMERLRRGRAGEIFQLPSAGEDFDAVKGSDLGKKLGDKCVANAWIMIP